MSSSVVVLLLSEDMSRTDGMAVFCDNGGLDDDDAVVVAVVGLLPDATVATSSMSESIPCAKSM